MSFRFNFSGSTDRVVHDSKIIEPKLSLQDDIHSVPCDCVNVVDFDSKIVLPNDKFEYFKCVNFTIKYVQQNAVEHKIRNLDLIGENKSDLLPGKYEGGLKVWECAFDLSLFIAERKFIKKNDSVLELGCGVGLPGITVYLSGGIVKFQDFNSEVLELVTIPNVQLNATKEEPSIISQKCKFLSGDWKCIKEKFYDGKEDSEKHDYIITSETIYEKRNQLKLLDLMKSALKPGGTIYLASKVHYFGVGGGIHDFEKLLKEDNTFKFSTVFRTSEGVERQILKLEFKNKMCDR